MLTSESVTKLTSCHFKTTCSNEGCSCFETSLFCSELCLCNNYDNSAENKNDADILEKNINREDDE